MDDPRTSKVVQEILAKTKAGKIRWEASARENHYFAVLPGGFTVTVAFIDMAPFDPGRFELTLSQDNQELLLVSSQLAENSHLAEVYKLAVNQALRIDAKVDEFLGELAKM